nr:hypothetical protein [Tanacetum cinerariifolium]
MSTLVFVDLEISTQADGAQSSRVLVPFFEDPYKAIRQAYLIETDTESEPFEDHVETETPKSPHIVASPTSLHDNTPPTCHAEDSDTPHVWPCVFRCNVTGLSASIADVTIMSDSTFYKRFRSSYVTSPSSSPPDFPLQKRSRGTSELVEDDEEEVDEEVKESLDSDSESEEAEDEGPTAKDDGPAVRDEGLAVRDEGPSMRVESLGLGRDEDVPEGQQRAAPVVETAIGKPLGLGYEVLRCQEIASREGQMPSVFEVGHSSGSVLEPERPERVSTLKQPTLTIWIDLEDGRAYINVPAYPPPAPHVQTLPSPEWSSGSLPVSPAPSTIPSPISSPI